MYHRCLLKSTKSLQFVTIAQAERGDFVKDTWTGDAVRLMHIHEISALKLANALGWNPKYLSAVLNCKRTPNKAEEVVLNAIKELIVEKGDSA